jgi:IS1 family transposase
MYQQISYVLDIPQDREYIYKFYGGKNQYTPIFVFLSRDKQYCQSVNRLQKMEIDMEKAKTGKSEHTSGAI